MQNTTIYIKADISAVVTNKRVLLQDVIKLYGSDKELVKRLNNAVLFMVQTDKKCKYAVSILKIIELIQKEHPNIIVMNVGEEDFVIEYIPPKKKQPVIEWAKVIFVCLAVFFGAIFTIMTFNEDVAVKQVFRLFYRLVMDESEPAGTILEISYAVGLPIGIIGFFNHFSHIKIDSDPTPLQVQLRMYEEDINSAIIENKRREGKIVDAG